MDVAQDTGPRLARWLVCCRRGQQISSIPGHSSQARLKNGHSTFLEMCWLKIRERISLKTTTTTKRTQCHNCSISARELHVKWRKFTSAEQPAPLESWGLHAASVNGMAVCHALPFYPSHFMMIRMHVMTLSPEDCFFRLFAGTASSQWHQEWGNGTNA